MVQESTGDSKAFKWAKLLLENKWLVMLVISAFSSVVTNAKQYFDGMEKDSQIESAVHAVKTFHGMITQQKIIPVDDETKAKVERLERQMEEWHK